MKPQHSRYYTLDHWRGMAALWVMLFHGFGTTYHETLHPIAEALKAIAQPGWLAVHLFFVISGYCITATLWNLRLKRETTWTFLKNRFWRLYPTYWLAFLLTFVLNVISSPFNRSDINHFMPASWQWWVGNAFLVQPYLGVSHYVVVYWSLVIEVGFYLIAAVLFAISNHFGMKTAAFISLILGGLSLGLNGTVLEMSPLGVWSEFLCGVLVYSALSARSQGCIRWHRFSLALIIFFGLVSLWMNFLGGHSHLWFSAMFSLVLYSLYHLDVKLSKIRAFSWIKFIGLMSYSLYLLHVPLQGRVLNVGTRFIPTNSLHFLILQVIGWIVAIAISYLFYCLAEKPLNSWRHQLNIFSKEHYENFADR